MLLSDLLDAPVRDSDGRALGFVVDVRLVLDGPLDGVLAAPRLHGLLVSPRTGTSFLGYERTGENAPALLARWLRHRTRSSCGAGAGRWRPRLRWWQIPPMPAARISRATRLRPQRIPSPRRSSA